MKKILFPTDFSEAAQNGFRYAAALASDIDAALDIMNIYSVPFTAPDEMPANFLEELIAQQKQQAEEKLDTFIQNTVPDFKGKKITVYGAFIPEEIIAQVKSDMYDLIIMGTKGERNPLEKLIGSITTRTMMNAPCPVLAIPKDAKYEGIKQIAYASDFKPTDNIALEQLMHFSGQTGANLNFVHVDTMPDIGEIKGLIALKDYPFEFSEFYIINSPSVIQGIDRFIEQKKVDMLALFIPKRRLWEQLFHQSFTKKYAFHTIIPLLVFHE